MTNEERGAGGATHWKAKVLPYSFLAVRKRASLAGGLLSSRNWWEVCMNFSCWPGVVGGEGKKDRESV